MTSPAIFIALPICFEDIPPWEGAVAHYKEHGDALRFVEASQWHLTLSYLGPLSTERVQSLKEALRQQLYDRSPFSYELVSLAGFPATQRARILACVVAANPELHALQACVRDVAHAYSEHRDTHSYRPHITVARSKQGLELPLHRLPEPSWLTAQVVVIYESLRVDHRPYYRPVAKIHLGEHCALPGVDELD